MSGLVDIHAHLLPGIDDGPPTLEESLEMARVAVDSGISTIAATPHLRSDFPGVRIEEIGPRCQSLQEALNHAGIPLRVVPGGEVSLVWALEASDEELRLASYGQRGTDLLIETPNDVSMLDQLLFPIRAKGFRITLGHPERSAAFQRDPSRVERLVEQGVLLQVNGRALMGRRSSSAALAEHLCREGFAHLIASDGHRAAEWRPITDLAAGFEVLTGLVGVERARWMAAEVPATIATGAALPPPPAIEAPRRARRWRRLFTS